MSRTGNLVKVEAIMKNEQDEKCLKEKVVSSKIWAGLSFDPPV